jgi:hypothetical protein
MVLVDHLVPRQQPTRRVLLEEPQQLKVDTRKAKKWLKVNAWLTLAMKQQGDNSLVTPPLDMKRTFVHVDR